MSVPFRERNPVIIGFVSLVVIALVLVGAFRAQDLPLIGGGDKYSADFHEAGGLQTDDEVRIAGVRVGKVTAITLEGDHVKVAFTVKTDSGFGDQTQAAIKIKTLLGSEYLDLQPAGSGQLAAGSEIPVSRTTSAFGVTSAFQDLAGTAQKVDTGQLATSLTTLADLTRNTPKEFKAALSGISRLSSNVAAKDDRINTLLKNLSRVSSVLDARDQDIVSLMKDSDVLFRALIARRQAIHNLLVSTSNLSLRLTSLVKRTRADLNPALTHLDHVVQVLNKNEDNLDQSIGLLAPFYRVFANTLGNGPWFDTYIQNLAAVPSLSGTLGTILGGGVPTGLSASGGGQ